MLRKIRITLAVIFMLAITLLFLDFTGGLHKYLGWSANVQLFPALLASNILIVTGLLLVTFMLGRIYCSVICPLGIFQDIVSRTGKKNRFFYRPSRKAVEISRYVILAVFAFAGINAVTVLLEPYSAYGRMASQILGPIYMYGNNILAYIAERIDSYAFYTVEIWLSSALALAVAVLTTVAVGIFAVKSGRGYCNSVCPIGTLLSIFAKHSMIKVRIDSEKCNKCGLCAKKCKASCIDTANGEIDYSRCVVCFNCLEKCPKDAIKYNLKTMEPPSASSAPINTTRRGVVSGVVLFTLGLFSRAFSAYQFDGGLAPLEDKKIPNRQKPIIPAGSNNIRNFTRRCTSCHLCVSTCPNQVLRPSKSLSRFLQPEMSFERGYCRPECVKCSEVCPTGAIQHITTAEKSATQIGYAVLKRDLCVVTRDNVTCDLCETKCPTAAITLIPQTADGDGLAKIPMIDTNRCIGCGACENLCPARPDSAIYVEGIEDHRRV